jgi:Protein of unknown function (DUF3106)
VRVPFIRSVAVAGAVALMLTASTGQAQGAQPKTKPPPAPRPVNKPAAKPGNNQGKQPGRPVPAEELGKLLNMSPEEREKALTNSKLTPAQRQRVQNQLDNLDRLSPTQRAQQLERARQLEKLPPARQQAVTNQIKNMNGLSYADQREILNSPEFGKGFSPEEQQIVRERYPQAASNVVRPEDKLVPARRQAVNQERQRIRAMTIPERREALHDPEFSQKFSPEEQQIIRDSFPNAAK